MAINIDKMRNKLDRAEGKGGKGSDVFWKPEEGEQTIRILPTEDGDPFREFWFHYNLGANRGFLSPKKMYGEQDALDEFVRTLFNQGTADSTKMAKELMARQRFFSAVIVRGEEDKGVRLWGYGKNAYKELLGLVLNPDYGDITDPTTGTDLVIKYGKSSGVTFPQTTISPRRRPSPVFENDASGAKVKQLLSSIPNYDEVFAESRKTPEEVNRMLEAWLAGDERKDVEKFGAAVKAMPDGVNVDSKLKELLDKDIPF